MIIIWETSDHLYLSASSLCNEFNGWEDIKDIKGLGRWFCLTALLKCKFKSDWQPHGLCRLWTRYVWPDLWLFTETSLPVTELLRMILLGIYLANHNLKPGRFASKPPMSSHAKSLTKPLFYVSFPVENHRGVESSLLRSNSAMG